MKRSSTRITVWPAIADLMTIIAILGVTVALVQSFGSPRDKVDQLKEEIKRLQEDTTRLGTEVASLRSRQDSLRSQIDSLEYLLRLCSPTPKCWADDANGNVQRLFQVEVFRDTFRLENIAPDGLLRNDHVVDSLVSKIDLDKTYFWTELASLLGPIKDVGSSRTDTFHPVRGCQFYGVVRRMEDMSAEQFIKRINSVNNYIVTGIPKESGQ